ncbi:EAL domain-containing protein [Gloeocapsa sp. PCC 73106]|uniref:EAL domain-containing protein n=1 Tax=Gloeocapsa sp. PCC 73106 TaxID=102232 RepID=UPI0002ACDB7F|nr:EAL domain-containing protein [Gloeocapsa sp. PCC 73106]ELR96887.1 PAS domain S-box/diguanylate cyclase (GGDEF) domain-containing protein [Gloeocapsa sp. PCC 73106]
MGNNSEQFRHILVIEDRKARRIVTLEDSTYSIGRDTKNDIVLYDNQVSRYHATLLRIIDYKTDQFLYRIIDGDLQGKRSTNGLIVNRKTCLSHELKHGDIVRFAGKAKAIYHVMSPNHTDFNLLKDEEEIEETNQLQLQKNKAETNEDDKQTLSFHEQDLDKLNQEELVRLASFPELSPNPIIEINWEGKITYVNDAGSLKFKNIHQTESEHPILAGLVNKQTNHKPGGFFVREVKIGTEVFEQYVHYLHNAKLIRSYIFDYTKRKQSEIDLKEVQDLYHIVMAQINEGILIIDAITQKVIQANDTYSHLLGYSVDEMLGLNLRDLVALEEDVVEKGLEDNAQLVSKLSGKSVHRRKDGSLVNIKVKINRENYQEKEILCFVINEDNLQSPGAEQRSQYASVYDPLTGLPNRTLFYEYLSTAIANGKRHHDLIAVMFIEINYHQEVNTPLEQQQQEQIVKCTSQVIRSGLRAGDTVARWDNHQFSVLLPRVFQVKDIAKIAQRLQKLLKISGEKMPREFEANIGITIYPVDGEEASTLLKNAVVALEQTKKQQQNNYGFYSAKINQKTPTLLKLEKLLQQALEKNQFKVYYQPIVQINDQTLTGLEASLYWQHPELGIIPPQKFLHLIEQSDLILPIGEWLLESVCQQNQAWQAQAMSAIPISLKLYPKQLQAGNLVEKIAHILEKNQLDSYFLEIEINSDCINQNEDIAQQRIKELTTLGIGISLGNFGTGTSHLDYLQKFTFRRIKMDPSLIQEIKEQASANAIVAAAIALGNGFKVKVVAQGVTTEQQVEQLRQLHCDEIQGEWFSKPLTGEEVSKLLESIPGDIR